MQSPETSGQSPHLRTSQRTPLSCKSCTRRKIKCDKSIPCGNCIKRGETSLCVREVVRISKVGRRRGETKQRASNPPSPLDAALSSDETLRNLALGGFDPSRLESQDAENLSARVIRSLTNRVRELESLLVQTTSHKDRRHGSFSRPEVSALEFGHTASATSNIPSPTITESTRDTTNTPVPAPSQEEEQAFEEAASTLEYLAWGRLPANRFLVDASRARPSPHFDTTRIAQLGFSRQIEDNALSPVDSSGRSTDDLIRLIPSREQARRLVAFHSKCLFWTHNSVHWPTFFRECEVFFENRPQNLRSLPSEELQWVALLFAVLCLSLSIMDLAEAKKVFSEEEIQTLPKLWFEAAVRALNDASFMSNHSILSLQAIAVMTGSAHLHGFSTLQAVQLAAAARIAQCLGLHRLGKETESAPRSEDLIRRETGRRVFWQLVTQDWFSVPCTNTYLMSPHHIDTDVPMNCNDDDMTRLPIDQPAETGYGILQVKLARIMPEVRDGLSEKSYDHVLKMDAEMRALVLNEVPPYLMRGAPTHPSWPTWTSWARRALTVSAAHKIIMIHRAFLIRSFTHRQYAYTRATCLSAAKTILNEMQGESSHGTQELWTFQAFTIAAGIVLALDVFYDQEDAEAEAHKDLVKSAIRTLREMKHENIIAKRGVALLERLLEEVTRSASKHPSGSSKPEFDLKKFVERFKEAERLGQPVASGTNSSGVTLQKQQGLLEGRQAAYNYDSFNLMFERDGSELPSAYMFDELLSAASLSDMSNLDLFSLN